MSRRPPRERFWTLCDVTVRTQEEADLIISAARKGQLHVCTQHASKSGFDPVPGDVAVYQNGYGISRWRDNIARTHRELKDGIGYDTLPARSYSNGTWFRKKFKQEVIVGGVTQTWTLVAYDFAGYAEREATSRTSLRSVQDVLRAKGLLLRESSSPSTTFVSDEADNVASVYDYKDRPPSSSRTHAHHSQGLPSTSQAHEQASISPPRFEPPEHASALVYVVSPALHSRSSTPGLDFAPERPVRTLPALCHYAYPVRPKPDDLVLSRFTIDV